MILAKTSVNNSQRVYFLAAASQNDVKLGPDLTNDQFLTAVSCQKILTVTKQCEDSSKRTLNENTAV